MERFVVDSSVALTWCFPEERTPLTTSILDNLKAGEAVVPILFWYEVGNVVAIAERRGRVPSGNAETFLQLLAGLPISSPPTDELREQITFRVLPLALRTGLTVYDAAYLDLALSEKLPLATLDAALVAAAQKMGVPLFAPQSE